MPAKARWCFPKSNFPIPPAPGAKLTHDGTRWCAEFTPAMFLMTLKRGGANLEWVKTKYPDRSPDQALVEEIEAEFELGCPGVTTDHICHDCPFK